MQIHRQAVSSRLLSELSPKCLYTKAKELLLSEEGIKHRRRRLIESEVVFGQMKFDMAY